MNWLDSLQRNAPWLAFPQLLRTLVILQAVFFGLAILRPDAMEMMWFDWNAIQAGEIWRLFSVLFISPFDGGGALQVLFFFFYVMIGFLVSDALENEWGSFRFSIFIYSVILCIWIGLIAMATLKYNEVDPRLNPFTGFAGGEILYASAFMSFAVLFPRYPLHLFGILPVPMWVFGALAALSAAARVAQIPLAIIFYIPLLVWAVPRIISIVKGQAEAASHRASYQRKTASTDETLHRCEVCKRTELDDDSLDFRVSADGREYCEDHLPQKPE